MRPWGPASETNKTTGNEDALAYYCKTRTEPRRRQRGEGRRALPVGVGTDTQLWRTQSSGFPKALGAGGRGSTHGRKCCYARRSRGRPGNTERRRPAGSGRAPACPPWSHTGHTHSWRSWPAGPPPHGIWRKALGEKTGEKRVSRWSSLGLEVSAQLIGAGEGYLYVCAGARVCTCVWRPEGKSGVSPRNLTY